MFARLDALGSEREKNSIIQTAKAIDREPLLQFLQQFQEAKQSTADQIAAFRLSDSTVAREEKVATYDDLLKKINDLQELIVSSAHLLPSYDLRQATQAVKDLTDLLAQAKEVVLPKAKFSFIARKNRHKVAAKVTSESKLVAEASSMLDSILQENSKQEKIHDKHNEAIVLKNDLPEGSGLDYWISHTSHCTITILDRVGALQIDNVEDCHIIIGAVSSSVLIEHAKNTTFVLTAQQIRIHSATHSSFYLRVQSDPIIEFSKELGFAPATFFYANFVSHVQHAGLNLETNRWNVVQDFNWLKQAHSPNWYEIPDKDRIRFDLE